MVYRFGVRVLSKKTILIRKSLALTTPVLIVTSLTFYMFNSTSLGLTQPQAVDTLKARSPMNTANKSSKPGNNKNSNGTAESNVLGAQISNTDSSKICFPNQPSNPNLKNSNIPELQKLTEYEKVCNSYVTGKIMVFTSMPGSVKEAVGLATDFSYTLKGLARYSKQPLVVFEPVTSSGNVDFTAFKTGAYDSYLEKYFTTLRSLGITDQMMGEWVLFPEANIPEWGNTNPVDVAACITKTSQIQKKYFPASKSSILLDSKSYPDGKSWDGGAYTSLVPYVKDIPKGLIDSFGLQGFPWPDPQPDYSAANFLNPVLAQDAASVLGIKTIWLNTGTFSAGKAWNNQTITLNPVQRLAILTDIVSQATKLQNKGYEVTINLFAENKISTSEGINWSYWDSGTIDTSPYVDTFLDFVKQLRVNNIGLSLADSGLGIN